MFTFANMNYTLTNTEATIGADEFIRRYRDVERIRQYCLQCPGYGKSWGCPPFDFDPTTCTDGFSTVRLMGTTIGFDEETRAACKSRLYQLEQEVPGSRCFTFRCVLCPEGCTRPEGKPCRHPERLRHSLESVGFDIVAMAHDLLDIELEWSHDGSLPKHITLVTALMCP